MADRKGRAKPTGSAIRCAIYTRKSTEEGLEQEFNSLDAQREACASYILSQRHEGWTLVNVSYDDGGFSGGNMQRPGLKRLLADIDAGKVDVIVVYKVDRLTRALSDFAKIVEILDARGASFVSITQAFNTTTSMGRLTLNVLLSFAQFEREVTGERIRDKVAASRAKGMWMGGTIPLGYDLRERKLVANETEATTVRHIMRRYLECGSMRALTDELRRDGYRTRVINGRGGIPFRSGTLYYLLSNCAYIGKVIHKGVEHEGEHKPLVPSELWDAVQARLATNRTEQRTRSGVAVRSLLAGLIYDGEGRRMSPSHTLKGTRRYHYYVTHANELTPEGPTAWRIAAHDIESVVIERVQQFLADRGALASALPQADAHMISHAFDRAQCMGEPAGAADRHTLIQTLVIEVRLQKDHLVIDIHQRALIKALLEETVEIMDSEERLSLIARTMTLRQAKDVRLIVTDRDGNSAQHNQPLVTLLAEAREAYDAMSKRPEISVAAYARETGRCRKRVARLLRIALLAPDIVARCIAGTQPVALTTATLFSIDLPADWRDQRRVLQMV